MEEPFPGVINQKFLEYPKKLRILQFWRNHLR